MDNRNNESIDPISGTGRVNPPLANRGVYQAVDPNALDAAVSDSSDDTPTLLSGNFLKAQNSIQQILNFQGVDLSDADNTADPAGLRMTGDHSGGAHAQKGSHGETAENLLSLSEAVALNNREETFTGLPPAMASMSANQGNKLDALIPIVTAKEGIGVTPGIHSQVVPAIPSLLTGPVPLSAEINAVAAQGSVSGAVPKDTLSRMGRSDRRFSSMRALMLSGIALLGLGCLFLFTFDPRLGAWMSALGGITVLVSLIHGWSNSSN